MNHVLCAADARGGFRAPMVSGLLSLLFLGAAASAVPAGNTPTDNSGLEEIVVTAEKRDSTVQATAISITALSSADLSQQNITSVEDLVGKVPGISLRTAGPGQTEYEMRGLSSGGGTAATVGFYIDETPLSASAVALNGRTVIDPDLFDLNHVETLRGPQGTLYGSGSMGGTIKLVTNQPKLGVFEGATDTTVSQTTHGSTNGGGSLMLNVPLGEIAALRTVFTEKYVSGFIDRIIAPPGEFPSPSQPAGSPGAPALCAYFCQRGDVVDAPVEKVVKGANLERYTSARAILLVKPSDLLSSTTTLMYQRIDSDGYNNFQDPPGGLALYQPYDQKEPYYDSFKMVSEKLEFNFGPATLTSATSYWKRFVEQSTDSTEALQNINDLTHLVNGVYVPNFIQNLYVEDDPTTQFSEELRLTSNTTGPLQWVGGLYFARLASGYITHNQEPGFATALTCGYATVPVAGYCPPGDVAPVNSTLRYPDPSLTPYPTPQAANPNGVVFNDNNPNVLKQSAIFGEATYKFTDTLKLTTGLRFFHFSIKKSCRSSRTRHGVGERRSHDFGSKREWQRGAAEGESRLGAERRLDGVRHDRQGLAPGRFQSAHPVAERSSAGDQSVRVQLRRRSGHRILAAEFLAGLRMERRGGREGEVRGPPDHGQCRLLLHQVGQHPTGDLAHLRLSVQHQRRKCQVLWS